MTKSTSKSDHEKNIRNTEQSFCRASSMLQQPHMLQAQAFPAQVVEKYAAVFHQSVVKPHHKFLPFLALPLCPTMLPCSIDEPHSDMGSTDAKANMKKDGPARACTVGGSRPKGAWCNHLTEFSCGLPMQNARPKARDRPIISYAKCL